MYGAKKALPSFLETNLDNYETVIPDYTRLEDHKAYSGSNPPPVPARRNTAWERPEPHYYHTASSELPGYVTLRDHKTYSSAPVEYSVPLDPDYVVSIIEEMEYGRMSKSSLSSTPIYSAPTVFQRAKNFVWGNTKRRVTTAVITTLIIGGIIGAYLGVSGVATSSSAAASSDRHDCTYPEGVNATFTQLQETMSAGNSSLSIPGLDRATCTLISMVINNTVSALKMGGQHCWQQVQSALTPLMTASVLSLNTDNIKHIISAVQQYCFAGTVTSPANTFTTFTAIPTGSTPTTITNTTTAVSAGTTAITTSTSIPTSTITSTLTSTSPTTIRTTATSLVTTSTGTTSTLPPSTTTTVPAGSTTVTTVAPTSTSTLFVSSSAPTTLETSTSTTTPLTTTTLSSTTTSTTTKSTLPCCSLGSYYSMPFRTCRCSRTGRTGQACPCGNCGICIEVVYECTAC